MGGKEFEHPFRRQLIDQETRHRLLPLEQGEERGLEAIAHIKIFTPDSNWVWYASAFDGEDMLFGLVVGIDIELGYVLLSELEELKGPKGAYVERDADFEFTSLRILRRKHKQERRQIR